MHSKQDMRPEPPTTQREDDVNSEEKSISRASANAAGLRFVRYNASANWGYVYFGEEKLGNAERLADGLYVPQGARNPRSLHKCAMTLASGRVARLSKELLAAQRIVSAVNAADFSPQAGDSA